MTPRTVPRLPIAPLLPYLQPEIDALNELARQRGRNHTTFGLVELLTAATKAGPPAAIEQLLGCGRRKAQRIVSSGLIREDDADHLAVRLGYHPALIWGGGHGGHSPAR